MPDGIWQEYCVADTPIAKTLTVQRLPIEADGCVAVPTAPGLGVDLDEDVLESLGSTGEKRQPPDRTRWRSETMSSTTRNGRRAGRPRRGRHPRRRQQRPAAGSRARGARDHGDERLDLHRRRRAAIYTDYHAAFGPPLLGHNDPDVDARGRGGRALRRPDGDRRHAGRGRAGRAARRAPCRRSRRCSSPARAARRPSTRCGWRAPRPAAAT